jgi:hypothetical protein
MANTPKSFNTFPSHSDENLPSIGSDREQVRLVAHEIVEHGRSIESTHIPDLRLLIEEIQSHQSARLAKPTDKPGRASVTPTRLTLSKCHIGSADLQGLSIGIELRIHALFGGDVRCDNVMFMAHAQFDGSRFVKKSIFSNATFNGTARFNRVSFGRRAAFNRATFVGGAHFNGTHYNRFAFFLNAIFNKRAGFAHARFDNRARFEDTCFHGDALFDHSSFAKPANLARATFCARASFKNILAAQDIVFTEAVFVKHACFNESVLKGPATFTKAAFGDTLSLDDMTIQAPCSMDGALILASVSGDCRLVDVRRVLFGAEGRRAVHKRFRKRPLAKTNLISRDNSSAFKLITQMVSLWRPAGIGWKAVRGLGEIAILNRVSIVALLLVPVLAAVWPAVQYAAGAYHDGVRETQMSLDKATEQARDAVAALPDRFEGQKEQLAVVIMSAEDATKRWSQRVDRFVSESPHLSVTLALAFFAAAGVTLGQLTYQVWAPEALRTSSVDVFIDECVRRYPAGSGQRDDGLRRATDAMTIIGDPQCLESTTGSRAGGESCRLDRHPRLVKHHGETIWIPPRDRVEWFRDAENAANKETSGGPSAGRKGASRQAGYLLGVEREEIALEEGARAEYLLLSRKNLPASNVSGVLYAVGISCLLAILAIQAFHVAKAADMWNRIVPQ